MIASQKITSIVKIFKGFSLLEIVVTISLLAVSLVAIITVSTKILQVEHVTENDFVAKGLLVEGLELAEAKKNLNVDGLLPFYTGLMSASPAEGTVYTMRIDYDDDFTEIGTGGNGLVTNALARLKYDPILFYQHGTGTDSKFYRMLKNTYRLSPSGNPVLEVESQVYWADHGRGSTQKLTAILTNR